MNKKYLARGIAVVLVLAAAAIFSSYQPWNISGFVIIESRQYADDISIQFNGTGNYTYEWSSGKERIEGIMLYGAASASGKARIYLDLNGTRKLVYSKEENKTAYSGFTSPADNLTASYAID